MARFSQWVSLHLAVSPRFSFCFGRNAFISAQSLFLRPSALLRGFRWLLLQVSPSRAQPATARSRLTIRSSGPLRRSAVLSCGGQQRPLNSSVMPQSSEFRDYEYAMEVLASDDVADFEQLGKLIENFPHGVDSYIGRHWIINAIDCGSLTAVNWMLSRKIDLAFRDEEGYTALLAALDRRKTEKYDVLVALLDAGAPINARGINDFTPAHLSAVRNDVEALRILASYGADFSIRTAIDDHSTPLEEAERLGNEHAITFLRTVA